MHAIIGAGPAGLYAALKLHESGVSDLVLYDPRAGNYLRPGNVNRGIFLSIAKSLGIDIPNPMTPTVHLKDIERLLYKLAKERGIRIVNKQFVRLQQDPNTPGIVVKTEEGEEETIPASYVLDCTGESRRVVSDLQHHVQGQVVQVSEIAEYPVAKHLFAYVKLTPAFYDKLEKATLAKYRHRTLLDITKPLAPLQQMGWKYFEFPWCKVAPFGHNNKVGIYMHAPDHLSEDQRNTWLDTVLRAYVPGIEYERIDMQKPAKQKLRFSLFQVNPKQLNQSVYQCEHLPTVIPLGDALMSPDYSLGHGIIQAMKGVDTLTQFTSVDANQACTFQKKRYEGQMRVIIASHVNAINRSAVVQTELYKGHDEDELKRLWVAKTEALQIQDRQLMRKLYRAKRGLMLFDEQRDDLRWIEAQYTRYIEMGEVGNKLLQLNIHLREARRFIPEEFREEKQQIEQALRDLARSTKRLARALVHSGHYLAGFLMHLHAWIMGFGLAKEQPIEANPTPPNPS